MSLVRLADTTNPPTTVAAYKAIQAATGCTAIGLYVPKWGTPMVSAFPNPVSAGIAAFAAGWQVLPILDPNHLDLSGLGSGGLASMRVGVAGYGLQFLHAIGADFTLPGAMAFDLEESDWSTPSLCLELSGNFEQACQGEPVLACQYGNPNVLTGIAGLANQLRVNYVWGADYINGTAWPTSTSVIPNLGNGLWVSPGQRGWQWHGGQTILGYNLDFSVVDFPLFSAAGSVAPAPAPTPPPSGPISLGSGDYVVPVGSTITPNGSAALPAGATLQVP